MARNAIDAIKKVSRSLRWRIVFVLLLAAMLPLALAGFGSWIVFGKLLEQKSLEQMRSLVKGHANAIEAHLSEQLRLLELGAASYSLDDLARPDRLQKLYNDLNSSSDEGFVDLGVIDSEGKHRAYVGPYDLQDRNYREAAWFKEVLVRGRYISDVFLGFRQVPHCIIAVRTIDGSRSWILRGTINSAKFDALVQTGSLGGDADAYLVSRDGYYQTTPKNGALLDKAVELDLNVHSGVHDHRLVIDGRTKLQATTWINDNRWMLVVERDLASVQAPVIEAITRGAYFVLMAVLLLAIITFLATRHLTGRIDRATAEREELAKALVRSSKLASIGELTTGLAHEINNPLAIISAEQTNISDILKDIGAEKTALDQVLESLKRCQAQVRRCAGITQKLLQFGRSQEPELRPTEVMPRLNEIINLMHRHARVRNVEIRANIEANLPRVMVDPVELEQILVNLINNALDAMPDGGVITVKSSLKEGKVAIEVADNGVGIEQDTLERVFEPFFTTKPPGKGTGLGLSVCYGIVRSWGGTIEAQSVPGQGTIITISVPALPRDKHAQ